MAKKDLSLRPKKITETSWWYEEKGGIVIVIEFRKNGQWLGTEQVKIPWHKIRQSLLRLDK